MSKMTFIARVLLGSIFFVFGLNGFFDFMSMPPMPDRATAFLTALNATGYFFPFLKTLETLCGVLLLIDTMVPLTLLVLAPIIINIIMFHAFLAPKGIYLPLLIVVLTLYLSFFSHSYSNLIRRLFSNHRRGVTSEKKISGFHPSET